MMELGIVYNKDCLEGLKDLKEAGVVPDLIVTDPPYEFEAMGGGVHRVGKGVVKYQNIIDIGTNHFDFDKFIPALLDLQGDRVNAYFFCNKILVPKYLNEAVRRGLNFDILVLRKLNPIPAKNSSFLPDLEYVIFLRSKGVYFNGKLKASNYSKVFEKNIGVKNWHPNEKPKELIRRFVKISSKPGDLVLDAFSGSGVCGVVCKEESRSFVGYELLKEYCDKSNELILEASSNVGENLNRFY